MVGNCKKCVFFAPALTHHHRLSNLRCAQRRTVDGSGNRAGSWQCGAACSNDSPVATRSHACCRQRSVYGAPGASQSGKIVKVVRHRRHTPRRTQIRSHRSSWAGRSRRPCPMIVYSRQSGHCRGKRSNGTTPGRGCLLSQSVR
jgi:hypothetical protein